MRLLRRRVAGPAPALRLLSRPGCHLCERLHEIVAPVVAERGGSLTVVNVDDDPELAARWGDQIPVLLDEEGHVVAKARDSADRIRRRI